MGRSKLLLDELRLQAGLASERVRHLRLYGDQLEVEWLRHSDLGDGPDPIVDGVYDEIVESAVAEKIWEALQDLFRFRPFFIPSLKAYLEFLDREDEGVPIRLNGQIIKGRLNGTVSFAFDFGKPAGEALPIFSGSFVLGYPHGLLRSYDLLYGPLCNSEFVWGSITGTVEHYREGKLEESTEYLFGEQNGWRRKYNTLNGKVRTQSWYEGGTRVGKQQYFEE